MPLCLCTIAQYTFYIICVIMLPIQGHCQGKKKKKKSRREHPSKLRVLAFMQTHPGTFVSSCEQKKQKLIRIMARAVKQRHRIKHTACL